MESVSDCNKNQQICDKAVDNYPYTLGFVPKCYNTQKMCNKAIDKCNFVFDSNPDQFKTQEMCDKIVSDDLFKLKYCSIKIFPDWFVTSKMIKKTSYCFICRWKYTLF